MLTELERRIVHLLRADPLLGSDGLAAALGTTRAAVNVHLSNLGKKGVILGRGYVLAERPGAVVIGGANMDIKARSAAPAERGTSNPGRGSMTPGGVARNIAENLARLGDRVHLVAMVGRDPMGEALLQATTAAGVRIEHVGRTESPTGTYTAVLDADGELVVAVADMQATADLGAAQLDAARDVIGTAGVVVVDGNLRPDALNYALDLAASAPVVFEPVSAPKAATVRGLIDGRVHAVTPDRAELTALTGLPTRTDRQLRAAARSLHERGVPIVLVTLGAQGSLLSTPDGVEEIEAMPTEVHDVTGAGDSMIAAFCHVLLDGGTPGHAARLGHAAAALTVASPHTVRPDLTLRLVQAALTQETAR